MEAESHTRNAVSEIYLATMRILAMNCRLHRKQNAKRMCADMFSTCLYARRMPTMIQLRHVPDDLHRKLKARAASAGMSLSDYLLREIRDIAERPTIAELRARLARRAAWRPTLSPARAVRAERDGR